MKKSLFLATLLIAAGVGLGCEKKEGRGATSAEAAERHFLNEGAIGEDLIPKGQFAGDNPLVGTWELVSETRTLPDGTTQDWVVERDGGRSIKIHTTTHFAVLTHSADGTFRNAHAGPYVLKDNTLTETLQNSSNPNAVGREVVHEVSFSGDHFTNSYAQRNGAKAKEVWKRVK